MPRIKIVCDRCGGEELSFEATAFWSTLYQRFDMGEVFYSYCSDCEDEVPTRDEIILDVPKGINIL